MDSVESVRQRNQQLRTVTNQLEGQGDEGFTPSSRVTQWLNRLNVKRKKPAGASKPAAEAAPPAEVTKAPVAPAPKPAPVVAQPVPEPPPEAKPAPMVAAEAPPATKPAPAEAAPPKPKPAPKPKQKVAPKDTSDRQTKPERPKPMGKPKAVAPEAPKVPKVAKKQGAVAKAKTAAVGGKPKTKRLPTMRLLNYDILQALDEAPDGALDYITLTAKVYGIKNEEVKIEADKEAGGGMENTVRSIRNASRVLLARSMVERLPAKKKEGIPARLQINDAGREALTDHQPPPQ